MPSLPRATPTMPRSYVTLAEHPSDMVRLACTKCARRGQYYRATLIERYGPNRNMMGLRLVLAAGRRWQELTRPISRCDNFSGKGGGIYDSYLRLARPAVPCLGKPHATPDNRGRRARGEEARRPSRRLGQFRRQRPGRTYQSSVKPPTQKRVGPVKPPKRPQWRFSAWVVLPLAEPCPLDGQPHSRQQCSRGRQFQPLAGLKGAAA